MAPSLTATPVPAQGLVNLTVTGATGAITVKAYYPTGAGTVSYTVRGSFVNGRVVPDFDAPLGADIVYIATDAGPPVTTSPQVIARLDSDTAWLTDMSSPAGGIPVVLLSETSMSSQGFSVPHKVLGTNAPLVTLEAMAYRSGTYEFLCATLGEYLGLRALLMPGGIMLLRSPCPSEYFDTTFIVAQFGPELRWNAAPPRQRVVTVDYQAVAADTAPPQDIAWTWADVPTTFATWADVPVAVATWNELVTYLPGP